MGLKEGKLDPEFLSRLLELLRKGDGRVEVGPQPGVDAAVLRLGGGYLVAASDPITFVTEDLSYYALVVNANDIAVMGARPQFFLGTLLLPPGIEEGEVEGIFRDLASEAEEMDILLLGGHTEVTPGIDRPILIGTMLGYIEEGRYYTSGGAREGDLLVLTKRIAIEGTSIIARERRDEVERHFGQDFLERTLRFNREPGISIVREALIAADSGLVTAMHDITEGGFAMGAREMAVASGRGLLVYGDELPIYEETLKLCELFGLDPLGLIGSGSLLLSVPPEKADDLLGILMKEDIEARVVGEFREREFGFMIRRGGEISPLPAYPQDEITKLFQ
ncbi:MAG TPA: hydrogenase [candidate division WOR-3 bacterium]|uniref:Hydrogenase n=1 Tax=candidate division WOR-3 bacterium TaxID=2052148 RepID=A0A7C1BDQ7_UNCW3|nr:hydrogenase [candidate division WOR-3 bacterium]